MSVSYRLIPAKELDATLIEAWRSIQSHHGGFESPYFCPEFTRMVGGVRDDVRVVVIENAGRPVGFFPHQRSHFGMGRPVGGPLSDCHGVIAGPATEWSVTGLMGAANLAVWAFDHLVDETGKFEPHVTARATSPRIDLSGGFEHYLRELRDPPQDFARKARKMAREIGELNFTLHEAGSGPLEHLIAWKREQYRRNRIVDVFGSRWTGELLRDIMNMQTAGFAGVCSVLRAGDRIVAVHAGMRSHRVLHWWFPAYSQEFARFSPGIILLFRLAEAMAAQGLALIDLGKGDEPYKLRVMTGAVELREGCVEQPSLLAHTRRLRRAMEARAAQGGLAATLRLPLRVIRRIERIQRFR
jgi:CelD/BcsL family acetyltransferase involved in cellulose biosynthesis